MSQQFQNVYKIFQKSQQGESISFQHLSRNLANESPDLFHRSEG